MPLCRAAAGPFGNTDQPTSSLNGFYHNSALHYLRDAYHHPLNPLHPLHPLNPHARKGVSIKKTPPKGSVFL